MHDFLWMDESLSLNFQVPPSNEQIMRTNPFFMIIFGGDLPIYNHLLWISAKPTHVLRKSRENSPCLENFGPENPTI